MKAILFAVSRLFRVLGASFYRASSLVRSAFARFEVERLGGQVGAQFQLKRGARISCARGAHVKIGARVTLEEGAQVIVSAGGKLEVGDDVFIGRGTVLGCNNMIRIGSGSQIAHYVTLIDSDHRFGKGQSLRQGSETAPIEIGQNVWIGTQAVVLKGVTVGDESVIGAGAVVTKEVPALNIATGVPAKAREMER